MHNLIVDEKDITRLLDTDLSPTPITRLYDSVVDNAIDLNFVGVARAETAKLSLLIENGKLTKTLRNPNYRATTPEFWHSLIQVGDNSNWQIYGAPNCGKGEPNQMIFVGHGSPVCAFANIEVFGGG